MERVHPAALDGAPRRHEGLRRHLAPEDPLAVLVGAHAAEDVHLDGLDVEQLDEEVQGVAHLHILAGPTATVSTVPPIDFPEGFLWGTATAAHQIEGGNTNNDWWAFEHAPGTPCVESSGDACDSWHRWPDDLDLVASLGLGAYRFSVEWSRIEPAGGGVVAWPRSSTTAASARRATSSACHRW